MRSGLRRVVGVALGALLLGAGSLPAEADGDDSVTRKCSPVHHQFDVDKCVDHMGDTVLPVVAELPDLVPDVSMAFVIRPFVSDPETGELEEGPPQLWFDTHSVNVGAAAFDVMADEPTNPNGSTVSQCVAWSGLVCRERAQVGGFSWHEAHTHFHYNDFATYALRRVGAGGAVDYSAAGLVATSEKVSFCLVDGRRVRDDASPVQRYLLCTAANQGISAGWADVYTADLPGQQLDIGGIGDGTYALVVDIDPADHVFESDDTRNRVEIVIELTGGVRNAEIVDRRWTGVQP